MVETINETRSRLKAAGTYFKSKMCGFEANKISVEVAVAENIMLIVHQDQELYAPVYTGTSGGKLSTVMFRGDQSESFTVETTNGKTFSVTGSVSGLIGMATVGKVFRSEVLVFMIASTVHNSGDQFVIPRIADEIYTASSIANLRLQVQRSKLILMPERGYDVGDLGESDGIATSIPKTYLAGGIGLPLNPSSSMLVPLTFVNYREEDLGLSSVVAMYRWDGNHEGKWVLNHDK